MAKKVFISYRRSDTAPAAGRLYDRFRTVLGPRNVFLDVDTIRGGEDFLNRISAELAKSDAVLVLMGPNWLEHNPDGRPRIWNEDDHVRAEIRLALGREGIVLPVLVDGTTMTTPSGLPEDVRSITAKNALPLRHESFDADVDRIMRRVLGLSDSARIWEDRGKTSVKIGFAALGVAAAFLFTIAVALLHAQAMRQSLESSIGSRATQILFSACLGAGGLIGLIYEERRRRRRMSIKS